MTSRSTKAVAGWTYDYQQRRLPLETNYIYEGLKKLQAQHIHKLVLLRIQLVIGNGTSVIELMIVRIGISLLGNHS